MSLSSQSLALVLTT